MPSIHLLKIVRGFQVDGPGRVVLELLRHLDAAEIRVSLVALDGAGDLRGVIEAEVQRLRGHVEIMPTSWTGVGPTARRIRRLPWFSEVTHLAAHLLRPDAVGRSLARATGLSYFLTEHGLHALDQAGRITGLGVRLWYRHRVPATTTFVAVSPKVKRQLRRAGLGRFPIRVVPNGVDLARFHVPSEEERTSARQRLVVPRDAWPVMLCSGGLTRNKALGVAVRTLAELRARGFDKAFLLICGEGPERRTLVRDIERLGVSRSARLAGVVDDNALACAAADVLLHPSVQESFGLVVAEALASGVPCVVRAGSGADAIAPPAPLSFAVDGDDPAAWAGSVRACCEQWSGERAALRAAARLYAEQHFSARRTARRYLRLLQGLTARRR